jgi:uncharacterized protein YegP (UPF0339 family)
MRLEPSFEVYTDDDGWHWRLRGRELELRHAPRSFESSKAAQSAIDHVRAAASVIQNEPKRRFGGRRAAEIVTTAQYRTVGADEGYRWLLADDGDVLVRSAGVYETRADAEAAAETFCTYAGTTTTSYLVAEDGEHASPFTVGSTSLRPALRSLVTLPVRGFKHRRTIGEIDTRIVVSGIRGKSSTTRRLNDVFVRRGYDTLAKITGNQPHLIHNGTAIPLNRQGPRTTLYENISVFQEYVPKLARHRPDDVAVFENQGITEYTTRLINEKFLDPHVVVLANVRRDHQDTLGESRAEIARSFAKSIPEDTHVVCGEQHPVIYEYLEAEVTATGSTIEQVDVPERHEGLLGAETVHAVNDTLEAVDEPPLADPEIDSYLSQIQPSWTAVPGGRVFNAAEVNDVESTEAVRQALPDSDRITPFLFLRPDRRGRTASFVSYFDHLAANDVIDAGYVMGRDSSVFAAETACDVTELGFDTEPSRLLDRLVDEGLPVMLMGNTVDEFMREFDAEIRSRAQQM